MVQQSKQAFEITMEDIERLCKEMPGVMDRLRCYVLERERDVLTQQLAAYNTTTHSDNGIYADNPETVEVNS